MKKILRWVSYILLGILLILVGYSVANYQADIPPGKLITKYGNIESKFTTIDKVQVHYRDEGDPNDSIPLVLLHGTSSFLQTWDGWTQTLKTSHRIIRLDLPAFGITGPNPQNDYSTQYYVAFLHTFLQNLGVEQCYLAGNSLGGSIAWNYTVAFPNEVKKLILLDAGGYTAKGKRTGGNLGFRIARMPVVNQLVRYITPRSIVAKSLQDTYGDDSKITDELIDRYWEMTLRAGNREALISRMQTMWQNQPALIKQIKCPTLIMWGELDQLIPVEHAELFHQDIKGSQVIIYQGVGHVPMEEIPAQTAKDVALFVTPTSQSASQSKR